MNIDEFTKDTVLKCVDCEFEAPMGEWLDYLDTSKICPECAQFFHLDTDGKEIDSKEVAASKVFTEKLLSSFKKECINTDILLKMAIHKIVCEAIDNINVDNNSWELREIQIRKRIEIELDRWLPAKKNKTEEWD